MVHFYQEWLEGFRLQAEKTLKPHSANKPQYVCKRQPLVRYKKKKKKKKLHPAALYTKPSFFSQDLEIVTDSFCVVFLLMAHHRSSWISARDPDNKV